MSSSAAEAVEFFQEAESVLKDLEHRYHRDLLVPAINQLRYAGKHLSRIIANEGDCNEEIKDAIKHCKRSIYDSYELEVIFLVEMFDRFQLDYQLVVISEDILPDYNKIVQRFDDALDFIGAIKANSREDYYDQCREHVKVLRQSYRAVKAARHPLNALMNQERKKSIQAILLFIGTGAAVFSALIAWLSL